jgi:hypothetical protein
MCEVDPVRPLAGVRRRVYLPGSVIVSPTRATAHFTHDVFFFGLRTCLRVCGIENHDIGRVRRAARRCDISASVFFYCVV